MSLEPTRAEVARREERRYQMIGDGFPMRIATGFGGFEERRAARMVRTLTLLLGCALTCLALTAAAGADTAVGVDCVKPLDLITAGQDLSNCNLKGVTISGGLVLYGSNLSGANLSQATIIGQYKTLGYANLSGANLNRTTISGPALEGDNLSGANLNGANVAAGALRLAIYSNTTCPDGTNSDDDGGTCVGHGVP
jgi:uncharacterized protein YjbI with pentapeptide repeats